MAKVNRRQLLKTAIGIGMGLNATLKSIAQSGNETDEDTYLPLLAGPERPLVIYNNWSAYDELSDNIPLTEALAMKELHELIRLRKNGVRVDYYMMDAFWFDKAGGYRKWHKERWPDGSDEWLRTCIENGIKPGMWFSTNDRISAADGFFLDLIPEWMDSVTTIPNALSLFKGGYLEHLSGTLDFWYAKGVRAFKFDFARFGAADAASHKIYTVAQIESKNKAAFFTALAKFRKKNPEALIIGYNGFGGDMNDTYTPFRKTVEHRWLQVFDTLYCGDPRFSDVPMINIWRSQDLYSDHMVRQYLFNGLPTKRIDNCGFMVGITGTCYKRALQGWKGMHILEYARGGWVNVFHGNLELFSNEDASWFAKVQTIYLGLQMEGETLMFGAIPGSGDPYGFVSKVSRGAVCTVVNPSQRVCKIKLPVNKFKEGKLLYSDGGFLPPIDSNSITLGPEQMAVVGFDHYANEKFNLGADESIRIPQNIEPVVAVFQNMGVNEIEATVMVPQNKCLRIFVQQFDDRNFPYRSHGGAPPGGKNMDTIIQIRVKQNGNPVSANKYYDKMIWSGLSWGAIEIEAENVQVGVPIEITCASTEPRKLKLRAEVFAYSHKKS